MSKGSLLLLVILALLTGCTALPKRVTEGNVVTRDMTWMQDTTREAFVDPQGVCHLFSDWPQKNSELYAEENDRIFHALGTQVKACFAGGLPRQAGVLPAKDAVQVRVAFVPIPREYLAGTRAQIRGLGKINYMGVKSRGFPLSSLNDGGFHHRIGGTSYLFVPDEHDNEESAGHEFGHAVKGNFHGQTHDWVLH